MTDRSLAKSAGGCRDALSGPMNFFYPYGRAPEPLTGAFAIARISVAKRQKRIPVRHFTDTGGRVIDEQDP